MKFFALAVCFCVPMASMATTITFTGLNLGDYGIISPNLGSNANSAGAGYEEGAGWTPDVAVTMSSVDVQGNLFQPHILHWNTGYGDLTNVGFAASNGYYSRIRLDASAGYFVRLNSFDLGGWPNSDLFAQRIRVLDGNGNILWNQDGTMVLGANNAHSSYAPNISGSSLILEFGNNWNIGVDNINFTQEPVPEPATMTALAVGALALIRRKRA